MKRGMAAVALAIGVAVAGANLLGVAHASPFGGTEGDQSGAAYAADIDRYIPGETPATALHLGHTICTKLDDGVPEGNLIAGGGNGGEELLQMGFVVAGAKWQLLPEVLLRAERGASQRTGPHLSPRQQAEGREKETALKRSLRMAGIAGAGALAIGCAMAGANLLGVAHADPTSTDIEACELMDDPTGPALGYTGVQYAFMSEEVKYDSAGSSDIKRDAARASTTRRTTTARNTSPTSRRAGLTVFSDEPNMSAG